MYLKFFLNLTKQATAQCQQNPNKTSNYTSGDKIYQIQCIKKSITYSVKGDNTYHSPVICLYTKLKNNTFYKI